MKKKLKLSRETVTRLTNPALARVAGGGITNGCATVGQNSYVHQTVNYPCNLSAECSVGDDKDGG